MFPHSPEHCQNKLQSCVRLARDCNHNAIIHTTVSPLPELARRFRNIRDEAMADARYWQSRLNAVTGNHSIIGGNNHE